jgi:hypothetical protein
MKALHVVFVFARALSVGLLDLAFLALLSLVRMKKRQRENRLCVFF